jgi:hypothetical protein
MCLIIVFIFLRLFNLFNKWESYRQDVAASRCCCIAVVGGSEKRARGMEKENQTAGKDKRALDRWKFKAYEGAKIWNNKLQTMASKT